MCLFTHSLERVVLVNNILSPLNPGLAAFSFMFAEFPKWWENLSLSSVTVLEIRPGDRASTSPGVSSQE